MLLSVKRSSLIVQVLLIVIGVVAADIELDEQSEPLAFSEAAKDLLQAVPRRQLQQSQQDDRVVISIPTNTDIEIKLVFKNGSEQVSVQQGPVAQFQSLDDVQQIILSPVKQVEVLQEYEQGNTVILSTIQQPVDIQPTTDVGTFIPISSPPSESYMQVLPGLILDRSPQEISSSPQFDIFIEEESAANGSTSGAFSTIADVNVDDRGIPIDPDFGISITTPQSSPLSIMSYLSRGYGDSPTLQRGLPRPQQNNSFTYTTSDANNLQYNIYNQLGALQIQLEMAPAQPPEPEYMEDFNETLGFDAQIMSLIRSEDQLESSTLQLASGRSVEQTQIEDDGILAQSNNSKCIQMEELIKSRGGDVFANAMKVAGLDYNTIGDIIVVFLPDSDSFQGQLLTYGIDLSSTTELSNDNLQILQHLLLYHIIPDMLMLNLASVATEQAVFITAANNQQLGLISNNDDIILLPQNEMSGNIAVVESALPEIACQGFLFAIDSVLIPANQLR
eukprot:TRINITY_DN4382_c0_g1_i1.p1 TRINITY_DN4382_c0_g1~~TRINITY_DN4382_c0_g1_i1.p1  ORF type:complete len:504 (-),score=49.06 TRINITY_DN4382_c0_g1_i1:694-2205(-)